MSFPLSVSIRTTVSPEAASWYRGA